MARHIFETINTMTVKDKLKRVVEDMFWRNRTCQFNAIMKIDMPFLRDRCLYCHEHTERYGGTCDVCAVQFEDYLK